MIKYFSKEYCLAICSCGFIFKHRLELPTDMDVSLQLQELKANPDRSAQGTVIDASLDKARGVLATVLVQNGTLHKGDVVLCGGAYGKVL